MEHTTWRSINPAFVFILVNIHKKNCNVNIL